MCVRDTPTTGQMVYLVYEEGRLKTIHSTVEGAKNFILASRINVRFTDLGSWEADGPTHGAIRKVPLYV